MASQIGFSAGVEYAVSVKANEVQAFVHTPLTHCGVLPEHFVPQLPQLFGSLFVFVHVPLQVLGRAAGQAHLLPVQFWPPAQATPTAVPEQLPLAPQ